MLIDILPTTGNSSEAKANIRALN